jgi:tripartite-type tricarboxylate transporter receptor subunit TctC
MKLPRRQFLHVAAGAAALPFAPYVARAQAYPTRPVRWVVGFVPGGASDPVARIMGQWLSERLGQPFVIENKPGAGSNIAAQSVVASPPDGYTLLMVPTASAINATFYDNLPFNFLRDIAPVAALVRIPNVIVVNPALPVQNLAEFIAYAKTNPGKINVGSAGTGTANHMAGELFKAMTGINLVHVPYRGGAAAITDLLAGQVQVIFDLVPNSIEHIKSGKLRALAVTTATRSEALPDVPVASDTVPGYEASAWFGLGAPRGTPAPIIAMLNREVNAGLANAGVRARLADAGTTPFVLSTAEFGAHIAAETEKWAKAVKSAGIKPQ